MVQDYRFDRVVLVLLFVQVNHQYRVLLADHLVQQVQLGQVDPVDLALLFLLWFQVYLLFQVLLFVQVLLSDR